MPQVHDLLIYWTGKLVWYINTDKGSIQSIFSNYRTPCAFFKYRLNAIHISPSQSCLNTAGRMILSSWDTAPWGHQEMHPGMEEKCITFT